MPSQCRFLRCQMASSKSYRYQYRYRCHHGCRCRCWTNPSWSLSLSRSLNHCPRCLQRRAHALLDRRGRGGSRDRHQRRVRTRCRHRGWLARVGGRRTWWAWLGEERFRCWERWILMGRRRKRLGEEWWRPCTSWLHHRPSTVRRERLRWLLAFVRGVVRGRGESLQTRFLVARYLMMAGTKVLAVAS